MTCKICSKETEKLFDKLVLGKYSITYFQCASCDFIQTEEPFWLQEAYSNAITATDVGLISRNILYSELIPPILELFSKEPSDSFLDFGGGYGMFVRIMRDKGYEFFLEDRYAENLFAKYFELKNYNGSRFKALTSFEVFEHLENPLEEISEMFKLSDNIIFSTELQPYPFETVLDWWYLAPEHGQHIAFYSMKTLRKISELFDFVWLVLILL